MEFLTLRVDEEIVNAFKHFDKWVGLGRIAETLKLTSTKTERVCWALAGKGVILWTPGKGREQLFKYNSKYGKKKESELLYKFGEVLGRDYYITGETALFLYNLTDHAMYQRIIEIALPKNKYSELAGRLVENLNDYAIILPYMIPKQCNKNKIISDALCFGDVIVLRKAQHNPRTLKFQGDFNLPGMKVVLEEADLQEKELFKCILRALDSGLSEEEFKELAQKKHDMVYLKNYLEGDKKMPENILNLIKEAENDVRGY